MRTYIENENLTPDAIENVVCKAIENAKQVPMNEEATGMLFRLLLGDKNHKIPLNDQPFLLN
jgi:hypothetical protein